MSLKIGVVGIEDKWSSQVLARQLEIETGFSLLVDMSRVVSDFGKGEVWFDGHNLAEFDGLVVKKISAQYSADSNDRMEILRYLEGRGVRVFSKPASMLGLIDRLSCTVTLQNGGIPMPETCITESPKVAMDFLAHYKRGVLKPLYTSKGRGMLLVEAGLTELEDIEAYQEAGNRTLYLQRFVQSPGKDLGLVFLGGEYLGTYARVKANDTWSTTTLNGGAYQSHDPSQELIDLAWSAQNLFDLDFTCVDLVETAEGPKIYEVSAFGGFRGLAEACDIDAAHAYARYIINQFAVNP